VYKGVKLRWLYDDRVQFGKLVRLIPKLHEEDAACHPPPPMHTQLHFNTLSLSLPYPTTPITAHIPLSLTFLHFS
jgi:hypothetical protein